LWSTIRLIDIGHPITDARPVTVPEFPGPDEVSAALENEHYLADTGLATAVFLALRLHRPLFLEGEPGVCKTALAAALRDVLKATG
jgi:MoxR-like ATPase